MWDGPDTVTYTVYIDFTEMTTKQFMEGINSNKRISEMKNEVGC